LLCPRYSGWDSRRHRRRSGRGNKRPRNAILGKQATEMRQQKEKGESWLAQLW
jgi:hypothetical protein